MVRDEEGFTLIELMVVVLVIAILLAIAIPTFLGARTSAWNRAAQSNVRNAHTAEMIFYTDNEEFTSDVPSLVAIDPALAYLTTSPTALTTGPNVYLTVLSTNRPSDTVLIGGRSGAGHCFWVRTIGDVSHPRFARNDCSSAPAPSEFSESW